MRRCAGCLYLAIFVDVHVFVAFSIKVCLCRREGLVAASMPLGFWPAAVTGTSTAAAMVVVVMPWIISIAIIMCWQTQLDHFD
jgi:hypothetical protein